MSREVTRTCVGCRQRGSKVDLLRLVMSDSTLTVDSHQVLPGRGAYVHPDRACIDRVGQRRVLARALRTAVAVDSAMVTAALSTVSESNVGSVGMSTR